MPDFQDCPKLTPNSGAANLSSSVLLGKLVSGASALAELDEATSLD